MFARLCLLVLVLSLTACANYPPFPGEAFSGVKPAEDGLARVYVYRPSYLQLMYAETGIFVDNQARATLTNDSYRAFSVAPGKHLFMAKIITEKLAEEHTFLRQEIAFEYTVEPGETVFLAWRPINRRIGDGYYEEGVMLDPANASANHSGAANAAIRTGATLGVVSEETALPELAKTGLSRAEQPKQ